MENRVRTSSLTPVKASAMKDKNPMIVVSHCFGVICYVSVEHKLRLRSLLYFSGTGLRVQTLCWTQFLSRLCGVTLGKSLNLSGPHLPHPKKQKRAYLYIIILNKWEHLPLPNPDSGNFSHKNNTIVSSFFPTYFYTHLVPKCISGSLQRESQ